MPEGMLSTGSSREILRSGNPEAHELFAPGLRACLSIFYGFSSWYSSDLGKQLPIIFFVRKFKQLYHLCL